MKIETVKVKCDISEIKDAEEKVERIIELLKEANSLADELASKGITLKVNI